MKLLIISICLALAHIAAGRYHGWCRCMYGSHTAATCKDYAQKFYGGVEYDADWDRCWTRGGSGIDGDHWSGLCRVTAQNKDAPLCS